MKPQNLQNYKAVILAGGKGTRLYPITKEIPKPLLPIGKKPIVNHLVDLFIAHGIKDIALLVSREFQEDFVWWNKRHYPNAKIELFAEQEPLGTFGGLWLVKDWLKDQRFFLTNGDELKEVNLEDMASFHEKSGGIGTLGLVQVENPQEYGVVVCDSDKVSEFLEKPKNPPSNFINSGLYLFSPEIFDYHKGPSFVMIEKDIFPALAKEGKLSGFKEVSRWTDCGTWERYEKALQEWGS
ncbi:MAG: nucleotidyltransferase family protein [Candidatus Wildermuthbacteria bacterium]|nr:nucleotidyltransferase family protein [Candidatus Wildermuthbacteria bacterium]